MKNYAKPMLEAVPEENARRSELLDLIHGFDHFLPIDPDLVPPASLIREFIGGGGIYGYKVTSGPAALGSRGWGIAAGTAPAELALSCREEFFRRRSRWKNDWICSAGCGRRKCDSLRAGLRPVARLHCACGRLSVTLL